jgi:hypothetical protein
MNRLVICHEPDSVAAYYEGKLFLRWTDRAIAVQAIAEIKARGFLIVGGQDQEESNGILL